MGVPNENLWYLLKKCEVRRGSRVFVLVNNSDARQYPDGQNKDYKGLGRLKLRVSRSDEFTCCEKSEPECSPARPIE